MLKTPEMTIMIVMIGHHHAQNARNDHHDRHESTSSCLKRTKLSSRPSRIDILLTIIIIITILSCTSVGNWNAVHSATSTSYRCHNNLYKHHTYLWFTVRLLITEFERALSIRKILLNLVWRTDFPYASPSPWQTLLTHYGALHIQETWKFSPPPTGQLPITVIWSSWLSRLFTIVSRTHGIIIMIVTMRHHHAQNARNDHHDRHDSTS